MADCHPKQTDARRTRWSASWRQDDFWTTRQNLCAGLLGRGQGRPSRSGWSDEIAPSDRAAGVSNLRLRCCQTTEGNAVKLYSSPTSPYVRKVRAVAAELGIPLELETVAIHAMPSDFGRINPVNRIPALRLDDGALFFDSRVICEY